MAKEYFTNIQTSLGLKYVKDEDLNTAFTNFSGNTNNRLNNIDNLISKLNTSPLTFISENELTDKNKLYVYIGEASENYKYGYIYYFDGDAWIQGWRYNSTNLTLDTKLTSNVLPPPAIMLGGFRNLLNILLSKQNVKSELLTTAFSFNDISDVNGNYVTTNNSAYSGSLYGDYISVRSLNSNFKVKIASYYQNAGGFMGVTYPTPTYATGCNRVRIVVSKVDNTEISQAEIENMPNYVEILRTNVDALATISDYFNVNSAQNGVINGIESLEYGNYNDTGLKTSHTSYVVYSKLIKLNPNEYCVVKCDTAQFSTYVKVYRYNNGNYVQINAKSWYQSNSYFNGTNNVVYVGVIFKKIINNSVVKPTLSEISDNCSTYISQQSNSYTLPWLTLGDLITGYYNNGKISSQTDVNKIMRTKVYENDDSIDYLIVVTRGFSCADNGNANRCRLTKYDSDNQYIGNDVFFSNGYVEKTNGSYKIYSNIWFIPIKTSSDYKYFALDFAVFEGGDVLVYKNIVPDFSKVLDNFTWKNVRDNHTFDGVKMISHRGIFFFGENTMPAFIAAYNAGFKWIETDLRFTSDNVPVLLHDGTIDRTSNGSGNINDMTLKDVRKYLFSKKSFNATIPTLEDLLKFMRGVNFHVQLEFKTNITAEQWDIVINLIDTYAMWDNIVFASFPVFLNNSYEKVYSLYESRNYKNNKFVVYASSDTILPENNDYIEIVPSVFPSNTSLILSKFKTYKERQVFTVNSSDGFYEAINAGATTVGTDRQNYTQIENTNTVNGAYIAKVED